MTTFDAAHFVAGAVDESLTRTVDLEGGDHLRLPALALDALVRPRAAGLPAAQVTLPEAMDLLEATGAELEKDADGHVAAGVAALAALSGQGVERVRAGMNRAIGLFSRKLVEFEYEGALGWHGEGWRQRHRPDGSTYETRWFPARSVHVLAGNLPLGAGLTIVRTALTRGTALLKLPSNDPFSAVIVLRAMAAVAPGHPIVRSFSAAYWRGGDASVESVLFRPQFFEKIVAWGGDAAIRNVVRYLGPGLDLVSFDPKSSISLIDEPGLADAVVADVARRAAVDVAYQEACSSSRFHFVAGDVAAVDRYCAALLEAMHAYHAEAGGNTRPTPPEIVDEVEGLRLLAPDYGVWGQYDGTGLVVRSDEPVDFYPDARTVNVVRLEHIQDVLPHVDVATQTVGVYPPAAKARIRDALVSAGVDRVVDLGVDSTGGTGGLGLPHDGTIPLQRLVRWIYAHD